MKFSLFIFLIVLTFGFLGCNANNSTDDGTCTIQPYINIDQEQFAEDVEEIEQYLTKNEISAQTDSSGIRYVITEQGTGENPTLCDVVTVTYEGKLMNTGKVFDGTDDPVSFPLANLITGWQVGIPLLKPGGSIILYIPSGFGYGSSGAGNSIPPNANLIFEISLVDAN